MGSCSWLNKIHFEWTRIVAVLGILLSCKKCCLSSVVDGDIRQVDHCGSTRTGSPTDLFLKEPAVIHCLSPHIEPTLCRTDLESQCLKSQRQSGMNSSFHYPKEDSKTDNPQSSSRRNPLAWICIRRIFTRNSSSRRPQRGVFETRTATGL